MNIFPKYFAPKSIFCKRKYFLENNLYSKKLLSLFNIGTFSNIHSIHLTNTGTKHVKYVQVTSPNSYKIPNCEGVSSVLYIQNKVPVHPLLIQRRRLSTNGLLYRYHEGLGENIFYEPHEKGRYRKKPRSNEENIREGFPLLKDEIRKWRAEMKEKFEADPIFVRPGDTDKLYDFECEEDLNAWIVSCDKDHNEGQSRASLVMSPAGHALFSGDLDTTLPTDGEASSTGYCNMTLIQPRRSFKRALCFDWMCYTHLVLRVRGDGRRYLLTLKTAGSMDLSWFDVYVYILYTRGGPYWQDVKIPFSKFFLGATGRAQDKQSPVPLDRIKTIGVTASDGVKGPFRLEVDYIGVHCDPTRNEKFAYEMYRIPGVTT